MHLGRECLRFLVIVFGQIVMAIASVILLVVVIGAVLIGFGAVHETEWLGYAGVVVATLGIIPVARVFMDHV